MKTWFKITVKYKNSNDKKLSENYLINAVNFIDAETLITKEMTKILSGVFYIAKIQKKNYSDIIKANYSINLVDSEAKKIFGSNRNQSQDADKWFDCKVTFLSFDENTGRERKANTMMLVNANSVNSAHDTLMDSLTGIVSDYVIEKVADSKIIDVFINENED